MTRSRKYGVAALLAVLGMLPLAGCESWSPGATGAAVGGGTGAVVGAAVAHHNPVLGALLGGAIGAGGGYLVGANWDKITGNHRDDAIAANRRAVERPARPEDVYRSSTADLNGDGFVTLDEVIAMKQAGLSDQEMLRRMQATGQVFELTPEQERQLADAGVDNYVITQMRTINHDPRYQQYYQERLGHPYAYEQ